MFLKLWDTAGNAPSRANPSELLVAPASQPRKKIFSVLQKFPFKTFKQAELFLFNTGLWYHVPAETGFSGGTRGVRLVAGLDDDDLEGFFHPKSLVLSFQEHSGSFSCCMGVLEGTSSPFPSHPRCRSEPDDSSGAHTENQKVVPREFGS